MVLQAIIEGVIHLSDLISGDGMWEIVPHLHLFYSQREFMYLMERKNVSLKHGSMQSARINNNTVIRLSIQRTKEF